MVLFHTTFLVHVGNDFNKKLNAIQKVESSMILLYNNLKTLQMYFHTTMKIPVQFDIVGLLFISEVTQMNNNYLSSI